MSRSGSESAHPHAEDPHTNDRDERDRDEVEALPDADVPVPPTTGEQAAQMQSEGDTPR